ncbi:GTPase [Arenibacter sp. M-2]|uniref:GTPase n=1 Tax=Arenibacter sp. M-2 TaxID=3053612 RepID=UPI00256FF3C5|nr:GTPase [Arenibacter sp. M-2]MDL5513148.1 GTPase [Arenibacter sp. M-2]|tara:strand:- start:6461 stop:6868 length:408 start_codon:yes stop_codon:yes gene_type:complete
MMDGNQAERLVFVYNANSGYGNALLDSIHKTLDPNSYDCKLCAITYGFFSENKKWKEFRRHAGVDMEFLHRDEFKKRYSQEKQNKEAFPQVFFLKAGKLTGFIRKAEINAMESQEDLILTVQTKLAQIKTSVNAK